MISQQPKLWVCDVDTLKALLRNLGIIFTTPFFRFMGSMLNLGPSRTTRTDELEYIIHDFPCFFILSQGFRGTTPGHHRSSMCKTITTSPSKILQCPWPMVASSEVKMQTLKQRPLVRNLHSGEKVQEFWVVRKKNKFLCTP